MGTRTHRGTRPGHAGRAARDADRDRVVTQKAEAPAEHARDLRPLLAATITAAYAGLVVWGSVHHEPWRDEVVPLSIARQARSLWELAAPLKFEGHPILWYLLLWASWLIVGQTWVLKAASVGAAIGAVALLNRSPLPWWFCLLFTFSFFPLYQYSVVSRGYTLEMLLVFALCTLWPRRGERPLAVALVLAALANTEAFGLVMAVGAAAMVAVEIPMGTANWRRALSDRWVQAAITIFALGLVLATIVAFPDSGHMGTGIRRFDMWGIADGVWRAIAQPAAHSWTLSLVPMPSLWIWAYFVYLAARPPLLCFAAISLVGFEVVFNLAHGPGAPWHIGNVVLAIVATMWLDATQSIATLALPATVEHARVWLGRVLAAGFAAVIAWHVPLGIAHFRADLAYEHSSNQRLGELLRSDPTLANAVVMGEPDTPLWSASYYADNRIYLPREKTFRAWGIFAPPRVLSYDLGTLLAEARAVHAECNCPVVVTLGWGIDAVGTHVNFGGTRFEERFTITPEARAAFIDAVRPLARLRGPTITDENYDVFVLR